MKHDEKACPRCAEAVKKIAKACKHCGHEFTAEEVAAAQAADKDLNKKTAIGCAAIIAIAVLGLATCGKDDAETAAEITQLSVADFSGHLNVEVVLSKKSDIIPTLGGTLREVRKQIVAGQVKDSDKIKTATLFARLKKTVDGKEELEPLAVLDYDAEGLNAITPESTDTDILSNTRKSRARPPLGSELLQQECVVADFALRATQLCIDAEGEIEDDKINTEEMRRVQEEYLEQQRRTR